jgi:hypothetical protein
MGGSSRTLDRICTRALQRRAIRSPPADEGEAGETGASMHQEELMQDVPRSAGPDLSMPFPVTAPRCLALLEAAVQDWLANPRDEFCRDRAHDIARAMLEGCKVCGYREDSGVLDSVVHLLGRPVDRAASTVSDLRERFSRFFGILKAQARVRSA